MYSVPQIVMVFGDVVFKEVIKLKWHHYVIQYDLCPYKKRRLDTDILEGECHVNMKMAFYKPEREASEETKSADTLIFYF